MVLVAGGVGLEEQQAQCGIAAWLAATGRSWLSLIGTGVIPMENRGEGRATPVLETI